jgi:AcrR family transcriptional regulator
MDEELKQHIVNTALTLAGQRSWEAIRLHEVAQAAGIGLEDIRRHFREKDALIDAWFDRADAAMLQAAAGDEFHRLPQEQRLQYALMAWLQALQPHRRVTREMILAKCEPGHIHIQFPAVMRISRTVQWLREAAGIEDTFLRRALAETVHTGIYLAVFTHWLNDTSAGAERTRRLLETLLARSGRLARLLPGRRGAPTPATAGQ